MQSTVFTIHPRHPEVPWSEASGQSGLSWLMTVGWSDGPVVGRELRIKGYVLYIYIFPIKNWGAVGATNRVSQH